MAVRILYNTAGEADTKKAEEIKTSSASIIIFMSQSVVIDFMLKYQQFPLKEY